MANLGRATESALRTFNRRLEFFARTSQSHEATDDLMAIAFEQRRRDRTVDAAGHGQEDLHDGTLSRAFMRACGPTPWH